jgi:hypothetical protein
MTGTYCCNIDLLINMTCGSHPTLPYRWVPPTPTPPDKWVPPAPPTPTIPTPPAKWVPPAPTWHVGPTCQAGVGPTSNSASKISRKILGAVEIWTQDLSKPAK